MTAFFRRKKPAMPEPSEYYESLLRRLASAVGAEVEVRRSRDSSYWRDRGEKSSLVWANLVIRMKERSVQLMIGRAVPEGGNPFEAAVDTFCSFYPSGMRIRHVAAAMPALAECSSAGELDLRLSAAGL